MNSKILSFGLISWLIVLANIAEVRAEIEAREGINVHYAESLMAQAAIAEITDIQVSQTAAGVNVTLVSAEVLTVGTSSTSGNALIIEIPNATLNLVDAAAAEQFGPTEGIAVVSVTEGIEGQVQIAITGTDAPPVAEVTTDSQGLVLAVGLGNAEAAPDEATATASDEETIRLVVTAATRTEASALDIPQSIQVIPSEVIENRAVNDVSEALEAVPGIVPVFNPLLFNDVNIRGFSADYRVNGLEQAFGANGEQTANIERIEILRGPASVLYGQGSTGGTINIITKQPTDEPFYQIDAAVGNFDLYRAAIDASGPLNEAGTVKYRLNVAGESEGNFTDFIDRQRLLIAPVLSWQISDNTDITFEAAYSELSSENNFALPARGTILDNINGDLERSRFIGAPDQEFRDVDSFTISYDLEHRFSDSWKIRNAFSFNNRQAPEFSVFAFELLDDDRTLIRGFFDGEQFTNDTYSVETNVTGNFTTGSIEHELLAGIDLFRVDGRFRGGEGDASSLDLFDPDYDNVVFGPVTFPFVGQSRDQGIGFYLQDRIDFSDNLILLLGGRFDIASTRFKDFEFDTNDFQEEEEFTPRIGLVYKPIPDLSLYGSYSRSFTPNFFSRSIDGDLFPPQRGTQYEFGAKAELNDSLELSLAYFDTTISNILTPNPDNVNFSVVTGEQRSQGIELLGAGEILPGWNFIGGYTYTDARVTEDNDIPEGNNLPNTPEHALSLSTTYEIQEGNLQGLGFGLGIFFVGERAGDLANSFEVPSYTRTDASVFYKRDKFRAELNFRNLFDIDYFAYAEDSLRVRSGDPLSVTASISYEF